MLGVLVLARNAGADKFCLDSGIDQTEEIDGLQRKVDRSFRVSKCFRNRYKIFIHDAML